MPSRLVLLLLLPLAACERPSGVEESPAAPVALEVSEVEGVEEEPSQEAAPQEAAPRAETPRSASAAASVSLPANPKHPDVERRREARAARTWKAVPADGKHAALLQSQRNAGLARRDCMQVAPADLKAEGAGAQTEAEPGDSFEEEMVLPGSVVW